MAWGKILKVSFILGLALYITFILTAMLLSIFMPFIPLGYLGVFSGLVEIVITIVAMGLVGAVVLKYIH
jgi:hypothetical protein